MPSQREQFPRIPGPEYMREAVPGSYLWKSVKLPEHIDPEIVRQNWHLQFIPKYLPERLK